MKNIEDIVNELSVKQIFTIKDLSIILDKQSQTIRKWERKGIISKFNNYGSNGWREYNREQFAKILEDVLNYPWERNTIYNRGYIQYLINTLNTGGN